MDAWLIQVSDSLYAVMIKGGASQLQNSYFPRMKVNDHGPVVDMEKSY